MWLADTTPDDTKNKLPLEFKTNRFEISKVAEMTSKNAVEEVFEEQLNNEILCRC